MEGSFGASPADDGVVASTGSSERSGVFARNDATDSPPPGSPGGAGVFGLTVVPGAAGVFGANNNPTKGSGIQGNGPEVGVSGFSEGGTGVLAHSNHGNGMASFAHDPAGNGVFCSNEATAAAAAAGGAPTGNGVLAVTKVPGAAGVFGASNDAAKGVGVQGNGPEAGVSGFSEKGVGLRAHSNDGDGTQSFAHSSGHNGLLGLNDNKAEAPKDGAPAGNGVYGYTDVPNASGVCGAIAADKPDGAGVTGIGRVAGRFFGDVVVTGDISLPGADYAEDFDVAGVAGAEPGTVMVLEDGGGLHESERAYDPRVAGVISGAGGHRPAVILDRERKREDRAPVALMGKVYCKIDARYGPVNVGDMLTTSSTPGHAMRAEDRERSFGAVLGKALRPLEEGCGLIPVLVTLQ